jgi:DNA-binding CsgD family transcriptional regulator
MLKRSVALVAEYSAGITAAELGHRYGIAKSSLLLLVRHAGQPVRHLRLSAAETARLVQLYEAGLPQKEIAQRLGRSPSAVWHCLRRLGRACTTQGFLFGAAETQPADWLLVWGKECVGLRGVQYSGDVHAGVGDWCADRIEGDQGRHAPHHVSGDRSGDLG